MADQESEHTSWNWGQAITYKACLPSTNSQNSATSWAPSVQTREGAVVQWVVGVGTVVYGDSLLILLFREPRSALSLFLKIPRPAAWHKSLRACIQSQDPHKGGRNCLHKVVFSPHPVVAYVHKLTNNNDNNV